MSDVEASPVQLQTALSNGLPIKSACPSPTPTIRVSSMDEERKSQATATTDTTDLEKHQAAPNAPLPLPSNLRRYSLLLLFSMAQFMDVYLSTAVLIGIAGISKDLEMSVAESVWMLNAYAATLAAFLLTAGRVSDIWKPKWVFIIGFTWVGATSLGSAFVNDKIAMFVLRAFTGIGAAFTIPSAIKLIVTLFPEEKEQSMAIGIFGGSGAIANVLGFVIGGVLLLSSWRAIWYFTGALVLPLSLAAVFLIPETPIAVALHKEEAAAKRMPKVDVLGSFFQTAAIVLLVFGLTQANVIGWAQAETLAPVIIGVALFFVFFWYQTRLDPIDATVQPKTWSIKNFLLLTIVALFPSFWWYLVQISFSAIMQDEFGWSPINTAVHFLPVGVAGGTTIFVCGSLSLEKFPLRWRLLVGCALAAGGSLLLSFAHDRADYWRFMFPAFLIGSSGSAFIYVSANIALVLSVPPEHAGVAGGVFNTALQVGATVLLALATTVQLAYPSAENKAVPSDHGYQASFLFTMATVLAEAVLVIVFFKDPLAPVIGEDGEVIVQEKRAVAVH